MITYFARAALLGVISFILRAGITNAGYQFNGELNNITVLRRTSNQGLYYRPLITFINLSRSLLRTLHELCLGIQSSEPLDLKMLFLNPITRHF